jgi:hypothetical protein
MQIVRHVAHIRRTRRRVAEAESGPIVGANLRELGDLGLDQSPYNHAVAGAGLEQHRRAPRADAIEIETARPVYRDQPLRALIDLRRNDCLRSGRTDDRQKHAQSRSHASGAHALTSSGDSRPRNIKGAEARRRPKSNVAPLFGTKAKLLSDDGAGSADLDRRTRQ